MRVEDTVARHEVIPDVALARSPLGGFSIDWNGKFIGWIHECSDRGDDRWNAYIRGATACDHGVHLGKYRKDEAVRKILTEAGWPGSLKQHLARRSG